MDQALLEAVALVICSHPHRANKLHSTAGKFGHRVAIPVALLTALVLAWSIAGSPETSVLAPPAGALQSATVNRQHAPPCCRQQLIWLWRHSQAIPIVFFTPENQLGLGAGTLTSWSFPQTPRDRPSTLTLAGIYTTRKQTIASARYELRSAHERTLLWQDYRYIDWPDRFYGIGNQTKARDREDFTDRYWQVDTELHLRIWRRFFLGIRHQLRRSETLNLPASARLLLADRLYGVGQTIWSGVGVIATIDRRDKLFWPQRGPYLTVQAMLYHPAFGADFVAFRGRFDLRNYLRLAPHHILATRLIVEQASGHLPFQLLPMLGGSDLFRGWFLGRLRDRSLVAAEAEWRWEWGRRWAATFFASVGVVGPRPQALLRVLPHAAAGTGLRFAIRPSDRAHVRLDVAYGDAVNVYLQFREAF